jgi:hypothetical protein
MKYALFLTFGEERVKGDPYLKKDHQNGTHPYHNPVLSDPSSG